MKKYLQQIGDGIVTAFIFILIFLFSLGAIEKLTAGEMGGAVIYLSLSVLLIVYIVKKVFKKNKNNNKQSGVKM